MALEEEEAELDALLTALARPEAEAEYPLPEEKPIKYTNVDVPTDAAYGSRQTKPEGRYRFAAARFAGACITFLVTVVSVRVRSKAPIALRNHN